MAKQLKLGDAIRKFTKVFHIPHCEKCERRRQILNEIQKIGIKETLRRLKAVGVEETPENKESIKKLIDKMKNCC